MNIYLSKQVKSVYFFDDTITFVCDVPISKQSSGLSFVVACICNDIYDMDSLAKKLTEKFDIQYDLQKITEMIIFSTVKAIDINKAFTCDILDANLSPKVNGILGMKYPQLVHIELTGTCNYKCSHCYKNATYSGEFVEYYALKEKIYDKLKGIVPAIHFTGGEPTLHNNFCEIINLFSDGFIIQLSTNGSKIITYPIEIFKKFQAIDVSLYGLSSEEYRNNTGNGNAYEYVKEGCKRLKSERINFRVTVVLNNDNWHQLEDYVNYAVEIGAGSIGISVPMQSGKLLNTSTDKWNILPETRRRIYREFRNIQSAYKDKIKIKDWNRNKYSDMWKFYPSDDSLRCGGGKGDWWMSEKFTFRPCSFLPDEYINLDYDTWYSYITNEKEIEWTKARSSLEMFAAAHGHNITDLCPIFRKQGVE